MKIAKLTKQKTRNSVTDKRTSKDVKLLLRQWNTSWDWQN